MEVERAGRAETYNCGHKTWILFRFRNQLFESYCSAFNFISFQGSLRELTNQRKPSKLCAKTRDNSSFPVNALYIDK